MQRLTNLQNQVNAGAALAGEIADACEMAELARDDAAIVPELHGEVAALRERLDQMEFDLMLAGPHDARERDPRDPRRRGRHRVAGLGGDAAAHVPALGGDARLAGRDRRPTEGEEAGIKSATVEIRGEYAYGYAKAERGVHRLVRISPFDSASGGTPRSRSSKCCRRSRTTARSSSTTTTSASTPTAPPARAASTSTRRVSAIRITHMPTGIVVTCQNERSQTQNREMAMKMLRARLLERREVERAEEQAELKGEHVAAGWGNAIRSYVLHPYKMVKDTRSGYETSNTQAVLNGEIDGFVNAYLRWRMGDAPAAGDEDAA